MTRDEAIQEGAALNIHAALAMAIHAVAKAGREPVEIFTDPTPAELARIYELAAGYIAAGTFRAPADGWWWPAQGEHK
jgi:hypothetical protein